MITGPTNTDVANPDDHKRLVQRFTEVINTGDTAAFSEVIAEQYVQHNPLVPQGLAGIQQGFQAFQMAFTGLQATLESVIAEGNEVVARFT